MSEDATHNVARVGDRYTSDSMICSTCRGLLIRPHETVEENTSAPYDFKTIAQSASEGCPICEFFHSVLIQKDAPERLNLEGYVSFYTANGPEFASDRVQIVAEYMTLYTGEDHGPYGVPILLISALSYGSNGQAQYEPVQGPPATFAVRSPITAINTGDHICLETAAAWLKNCITSHEVCNTNMGLALSAIRPTRVLHATATTVRLTSNDNWSAEENPSYMTVSHKWSKKGMPKLLKRNLEEMHQGLQVQTLPAVFRDAVALARTLGIRYVWIDALCIVQDDPDELQHEISNMGHIYRNAILNVGALQAAKVEEDGEEGAHGLFVDRNPRDCSPFALKIQRSGFKNDCFAYQSEYSDLNRSSIMQRGWVLQERLLSRRSIYFGDQIWWECGQQLAREPFPDHIPSFSNSGDLPGYDTPYRITNFLSQTSPSEQYISDGEMEIHANMYSRWDDIAVTFSQCKLSFEQDYLVALSGVAQEFQTRLADKYYAGLWGENVLKELLWHRNTSHYSDDAARPKAYRAPSWAWASFNLEIDFLYLHWTFEIESIAEILEISITPIGSNSTGRVSGGHLRISGHLRPKKRSLSKRYTRHIGTWATSSLLIQYEWFEEGYTSDGTRPMETCFFFLVAYTKRRTSYDLATFPNTLTDAEAKGNRVIDKDGYSVDLGNVLGLILEAVDLERSVYRRIGAFRHMWGDGRTTMDNPRPEDYPEFLDFDPENFERHTITII